jgi:hypothetical protein
MEFSEFYSPQAGRRIEAPRHAEARFAIGDVVRHKLFDFRGVVFDIDPVFANSEEWYEAIPQEMRPAARPAVLPPAGRERGIVLRRLRQPAEPHRRRGQRAGRPPQRGAAVRDVRQRPLPAAPPPDALSFQRFATLAC